MGWVRQQQQDEASCATCTAGHTAATYCVAGSIDTASVLALDDALRHLLQQRGQGEDSHGTSLY